MKKIFILGIFLLLMPVIVNAENTCSYDEIVKVKTKASQVNFSAKDIVYKVTLDNTDAGVPIEKEKYAFNLYIDNAAEDLDFTLLEDGVYYSSYSYEYLKDNSLIHTTGDLSKVKKYTLKINSTKCDYMELRLITVTIPKYNDFYETPACQNNPDYYLCQKFLYSEFEPASGMSKSITDYVNGLVDEDGNPIEEKENKKDYMKYLYIILVIAVGFLIYRLIRYINIRRRESI